MREAARQTEVSSSTMQKWINHYKAEGGTGLQDGNKDQRSYDMVATPKTVQHPLPIAPSLTTNGQAAMLY